MKNRSIPKSNPKFGKAKEPKPSKPPVARRVNLGRDARSGESLETGRADVIAARVGLTRRDAATSANETPEVTISPTTTHPAPTANVGETHATVEASTNNGRKGAKTPKPPKAPKPAKQPKERKPKRVSALDAAATILADTGKPMRATELIAEMEQRGLWKSPGGKTPESTLYAAIAREIAFKGDASRFARSAKGFFIARKQH